VCLPDCVCLQDLRCQSCIRYHPATVRMPAFAAIFMIRYIVQEPQQNTSSSTNHHPTGRFRPPSSLPNSSFPHSMVLTGLSATIYIYSFSPLCTLCSSHDLSTPCDLMLPDSYAALAATKAILACTVVLYNGSG